MATKDFPQNITDPANWEPGLQIAETGTNKFAAFGSIYLEKSGDEHFGEKIAWVKIPNHEPNTTYLVSITMTMLSAKGGDFDQDDTVFADIFSIGVDPNTQLDIKPDAGSGFGGVWGHHFRGDARSMGISTYIGPITGNIVKLRLACRGDNWVGASYFVCELGQRAQ